MNNSSAGGAQVGLATAARVTALLMAVLSAYVIFARFDGLAFTFFGLQDGYVILGFSASLLLLSILPRRKTAPQPSACDTCRSV